MYFDKRSLPSFCFLGGGGGSGEGGETCPQRLLSTNREAGIDTLDVEEAQDCSGILIPIKSTKHWPYR